MRAVAVLSALFAFFLSSEIALAGAWMLDPSTSKAEFSAPAKAPGSMLDVTGKNMPVSGEVTVDDAGVATGWAKANFSKVDTANDLRNEHTRKYLGAEGKLVLKPWKVTPTWSKMCGDLAIKGEAHEVCGEAKASDEGGKKHVEAKFHLSMLTWKSVGVPEYNGISLHDGADVTVDAWGVKK